MLGELQWCFVFQESSLSTQHLGCSVKVFYCSGRHISAMTFFRKVSGMSAMAFKKFSFAKAFYFPGRLPWSYIFQVGISLILSFIFHEGIALRWRFIFQEVY